MTIPVSKLNVINMVLTHLGRNTVANANNDPNGNLISRNIDIYFPELLVRTNWNQTVAYVNDSSPLTDNFNPEFKYAYQLPANFGTIYKVQKSYRWAIYDNMIFSDANPIQYFYNVNIANFGDGDFSIFPQIFIIALSLYVASMCCTVITNNVSLTNDLVAQSAIKIKDAGTFNRFNQQILQMPNNDYDRFVLVSS
jgi:hypothetical protein